MEYLLATDLDNTLVGDDKATALFNQQLQSHRRYITLVYATGRSYDSANQLMKQKNLLQPDYWITGVGTEIYYSNRRGRDRAWASIQNKRWNRSIATGMLWRYPELELQPPEEQNPWKISLWLKQSADPKVLRSLKSRLLQTNIAAQIIYSSSRDVDIVPRSADKGKALSYLRSKLDIGVSKTLVFGDSGNDISLFQQLAFGVIVRNAQPELLDWYRIHGTAYHYLTNAPYAAGMLEGLKKFQFC